MNIQKCSACGQTHKNIKARALRNKIKVNDKWYTHYTICPETEVKVYMAISTSSFFENDVIDNVAQMGDYK